MILRKHPMVLILGLVILGLLVWGFLPQPIPVEVAEVRHAPMSISIEEEGRTRLKDRYVVSAPVDGVTCRVELEVGDSVEQGQVLLNMFPLESQALDARSRAEATANISAAESSLRAAEQQAWAAQAAASLAAKELQRLRPLAQTGVISRDEFDRAITQANQTTADKRAADYAIEVAQHELEAAQSQLDYKKEQEQETIPIKSPITGHVLKVMHECAGPVRTGDALLEVGDPKQLEIEVDVLSADAVKIKPGMQVLFERWGGEKPLEGRVRTVEPIGFTKVSALGVEEQRVLVISDFTSPAKLWKKLGDGYRVEASFVIWHEERVLQVPASSIFRFKDGWALFVFSDGKAQRRQIKIGQRNGLVAQVLEGLEQGEQVINHPSDEIEPGVHVEIRELN